jgi:hypothetical protein
MELQPRSALNSAWGARDNSAEVGDLTAPDVDIEIDVEADAKPTTP